MGAGEALKNYEVFRKDGKLPGTLDAASGHAWKLESKKSIDDQKIIEFDPKARMVRA